MSKASKLKKRLLDAVETCKAVNVDYSELKALWSASFESRAAKQSFRAALMAHPDLHKVKVLFEIQRRLELEMLNLPSPASNSTAQYSLRGADAAMPSPHMGILDKTRGSDGVRYFTVIDDDGNAYSAYEYLAPSWFDEAGNVCDESRLRMVTYLMADRTPLARHPRYPNDYISYHPRIKRYRVRA